MGDDDGGVATQGYFLDEGVLWRASFWIFKVFSVLRVFRVLRVFGILRGFNSFCALRFSFRTLGEAFIDLLEEWRMVVEFLHIERAVDVDDAVVGDGVTIFHHTIFLCATCPVVGGGIGGISIEPVEDRYEVERKLVRGSERLVIVERSAEVLDALPYGVFPRLILLWVEVFVDLQIWLLYLCLSGALEGHVEVLGQVPTQLEVTVPQEAGVPRSWYAGRRAEVFKVALLQLVVVTGHLGIEGDVLRHVVEGEPLEDVVVLGLRLYLLEWLERFIYWRP